jgi:2-oxo-4-hydroxy-4-carboxy-5-ureidoimidazoline decarboxylase
MNIEVINLLPDAEVRAALTRCCGAAAWVEGMCASRPFADRASLFARADAIARALTRADWLEAFSHHPQIGDVSALRDKFAATAAWASQEQQGARAASDRTLEALARGNRAYVQRFGYIFIVCATGRSADEMLAMLESRLGNDPADELRIAAAEQMKITRLRLEKLLEDS